MLKKILLFLVPFAKLVEMPSIPVLFLDGRLSIVFCSIIPLTLLSANLQFKFSSR